MLKRILIGCLAVSVLFSSNSIADAKKRNKGVLMGKKLYADVLLVTKVKHTKEDMIVFGTCQNGNVFSFVCSSDSEYEKNCLVAVIMDSNNTCKVEDDMIVSATYGGWISKREAKKWVK